MKTQVGSGVNFIFPILERSRSVFIETEAMFSNSTQRLEDVKKRLVSKGHEVTVLQGGPIPTIKINNLFYEAMPQAVIVRVPIHGVRLLPRRPI